MQTVVRFTCRVAIGIGGVAVLDLKEWPEADFQVKPGIKLTCIRDDIQCNGTEDWLLHLMTDVPVDHGIYDVTGGAIFSDDYGDYGGVVFEGV